MVGLRADKGPVFACLSTNASFLSPIDIKTADDLFGPGAKPGTVPTDLEQSTGLERLEILGKMEGVDIFDMRPLDASRKGESSATTPTHRRCIFAVI